MDFNQGILVSALLFAVFGVLSNLGFSRAIINNVLRHKGASGTAVDVFLLFHSIAGLAQSMTLVVFFAMQLAGDGGCTTGLAFVNDLFLVVQCGCVAAMAVETLHFAMGFQMSRFMVFSSATMTEEECRKMVQEVEAQTPPATHTATAPAAIWLSQWVAASLVVSLLGLAVDATSTVSAVVAVGSDSLFCSLAGRTSFFFLLLSMMSGLLVLLYAVFEALAIVRLYYVLPDHEMITSASAAARSSTVSAAALGTMETKRAVSASDDSVEMASRPKEFLRGSSGASALIDIKVLSPAEIAKNQRLRDEAKQRREAISAMLLRRMQRLFLNAMMLLARASTIWALANDRTGSAVGVAAVACITALYLALSPLTLALGYQRHRKWLTAALAFSNKDSDGNREDSVSNDEDRVMQLCESPLDATAEDGGDDPASQTSSITMSTKHLMAPVLEMDAKPLNVEEIAIFRSFNKSHYPEGALRVEAVAASGADNGEVKFKFCNLDLVNMVANRHTLALVYDIACAEYAPETVRCLAYMKRYRARFASGGYDDAVKRKLGREIVKRFFYKDDAKEQQYGSRSALSLIPSLHPISASVRSDTHKHRNQGSPQQYDFNDVNLSGAQKQEVCAYLENEERSLDGTEFDAAELSLRSLLLQYPARVHDHAQAQVAMLNCARDELKAHAKRLRASEARAEQTAREFLAAQLAE